MSSGWESPGPGGAADASALAELAVCEGFPQIAAFAARRAAAAAGADAALLFSPDAAQTGFVCAGAWGEGTPKALRRAAPRDRGLLHELLRDRSAVLLGRDRFAHSDDALLVTAPPGAEACLLLPVVQDRAVAAVVALFFRRAPEPAPVLAKTLPFLEAVVPALAKARAAERKASGMLQAIERLTSLFDLSKAFGSTIDLAELDRLIVQKAADFCACEAASLWFLEGDGGEVVLAATAVNPNYDIASPPVSVGASVVADVLANTEVLRRNSLPEDDAVRTADPAYPVSSILAVPLVENDAPVGALVLANKRGRHPGVQRRRRGAARRPRPAGRPRPPQRPPVRGREEGRRARRPPDREPRDHVHAGPRQGHARDRELHRGAHPLRPVRDRHPGPGPPAARRGLGNPRAGPRPARPEADHRDPRVGLRRRRRRLGRRERGRDARDLPARDDREVPRVLRGEQAEVVLRDPPQGRGGSARRPRVRELRAARVRRGDAQPPPDPRQPGHRRRAQRPALPSGAPRRLPAAPPRAEEEAPGRPALPPRHVEPRSDRSSRRALSRAVAVPAHGKRARASRAARLGHGGRGRRRGPGPQTRGRLREGGRGRRRARKRVVRRRRRRRARRVRHRGGGRVALPRGRRRGCRVRGRVAPQGARGPHRHGGRALRTDAPRRAGRRRHRDAARPGARRPAPRARRGALRRGRHVDDGRRGRDPRGGSRASPAGTARRGQAQHVPRPHVRRAP